MLAHNFQIPEDSCGPEDHAVTCLDLEHHARRDSLHGGDALRGGEFTLCFRVVETSIKTIFLANSMPCLACCSVMVMCLLFGTRGTNPLIEIKHWIIANACCLYKSGATIACILPLVSSDSRKHDQVDGNDVDLGCFETGKWQRHIK